MKQILCVLLTVATILCFFAGCDRGPSVTAPPVTTAPSGPNAQGGTPQPPALPYLQKVTRADQSIYEGPSYDHMFVGTVALAGTYTIVEEARDEEGNLWGKLKSGIGWIDLTQVRAFNESPAPLTANYADDTLLDSGNFHRYTGAATQATHVAFRAYETLTAVTLYAMDFVEAIEVAETLYSIDTLTPDKPLVADLAFLGSMSFYGIRFTDSKGVVHFYSVSISGRDSSVVLTDITS